MLPVYALLDCWLEGTSYLCFHCTVVMLSDDIAEEEAHSEDRSAIGDEDEMADFIVDEDVDEVGDLATCGFSLAIL